jgi:hypothetical protein
MNFNSIDPTYFQMGSQLPASFGLPYQPLTGYLPPPINYLYGLSQQQHNPFGGLASLYSNIGSLDQNQR